MDEGTKKVIDSLEKKGAWGILVALNKSEACVSELKRKAGVSNGTIQKRLKALEEVELVRKEVEIGNDGRRRKIYSLSEKGRQTSQIPRQILSS